MIDFMCMNVKVQRILKAMFMINIMCRKMIMWENDKMGT